MPNLATLRVATSELRGRQAMTREGQIYQQGMKDGLEKAANMVSEMRFASSRNGLADVALVDIYRAIQAEADALAAGGKRSTDEGGSQLEVLS
jgi:hypothetical protein